MQLLSFMEAAKPYTVNKVPRLKIEYAVQKVMFRISQKMQALEKEQNEKRATIRENYAMVDADGCYVYETKKQNGKDVEVFKFTKENFALMKKELHDLEDKTLAQVIEIEPHVLNTFPPMNEWEINAFRGLVIPEDSQLPEPEEAAEPATK